MRGHLIITKSYKNNKTDEIVVNSCNSLSDGLYFSLISLFSENSSSKIADFRANYFQVGTGNLGGDEETDSNFYELSNPLTTVSQYGIESQNGIEELSQIVHSSGNFSDDPLSFTTKVMPFAVMGPKNITKITENGAHHRIEIDREMANGETISEVALFSKNPEGHDNDRPIMMAYKSFSPLTKEQDFSFVFDWTIYL